MGNTIDLSKSVYEICKEHPAVIEIMKELGFESIANPGMLNAAGRFMTIPKGAAMKNISMDKVIGVFSNRSYEVKPRFEQLIQGISAKEISEMEQALIMDGMQWSQS